MQLKKSLEELGLSQIEISIYSYLLSKGESYGKQIYKDNELDKSAAYKAITNLIARELIVSSGDSRNQIYKVAPKEKVLSLFEQKKAEVEQSKVTFLSAITDIKKYSADHYHSENVEVFVGPDAHDRYHKSILKTEASLLRTITNSATALLIAGHKEQLDSTNAWFIKERVAKGMSVRVLYDSVSQPDEYDISNSKLLKECRRYSKELSLNSVMSTFGNKVGFSTIKESKYWALIITDQLIVDLLNSLFDALWQESQVV